MDSIEITINRTGATTAVAAKYLARPDSHIATICGCGNQGRVQLRFLNEVLPIDTAYAFDLQEGIAESYAEEMAKDLGIEVITLELPGGMDGKSADYLWERFGALLLATL